MNNYQEAIILLQNEEFVNSIQNDMSEQDICELFATKGVHLSIEELNQLGKAMKEVFEEEGVEMELKVDELNDVAGGVCFIRPIGGIPFNNPILMRKIDKWGRKIFKKLKK